MNEHSSKYKIGDVLEDIVFNTNRKYVVMDVWKNIFGEYVYQLQDVKRPEVQIKELEKFLTKDYKEA